MNKQEILKFISYLVTSAREFKNEPKIYGSFRLIDAVDKFVKFTGSEDKNLKMLVEKLNKKKSLCMTDEEGFYSMLDDVIFDLVDLMSKEKGQKN